MNHEIDNGGLEALAQALIDTDLTGFQVRAKPNTKELLRQKLASSGPVAAWWADKLTDGTQIEHGAEWMDFVSSKSLHEDYVRHHRPHGGRGPAITHNVFIPALKKLCPSAIAGKDRESRRRGLNFPSLIVARSELEQYMGGPV